MLEICGFRPVSQAIHEENVWIGGRRKPASPAISPNRESGAEGVAQDEITTRGPDYIDAVSKRFAAITGASSDEVSFSEQLTAVKANVTIGQEQLRDLAQARAVATKEYLVNELGLSADRAVINQVGELLEEENNYSGVVLELDT